MPLYVYKENIYEKDNNYLNFKNGLTDIQFGLSILTDDEKDALKEFKKYHETMEETDFTISDTKKLTDEQLKRRIIKKQVELDQRK